MGVFDRFKSGGTRSGKDADVGMAADVQVVRVKRTQEISVQPQEMNASAAAHRVLALTVAEGEPSEDEDLALEPALALAGGGRQVFARSPTARPALLVPERAAMPAVHDEPVRQIRHAAAPQQVLVPINGHEADDGIELVHGLFPTWKGECFGGVVAPDMAKALVVLWLGLGDAALVGTPEALNTSHVKTVRDRLITDLHLQVVEERGIPQAVVQRLVEAAANGTARSRRLEGGMISKENYHLVIYDEIVAAAVRGRASDIHFSIRKAPHDGALIALRMFGRYRPWRTTMSATLIRSVLGSAFGQRLASKTNSKSDLHYDNEVAFMTENQVDAVKWMGRCNGRPDVRGYKMVIRLLESDPHANSIPTLAQLGYVDSHCSMLEMAVRRNYGVIIIFGSTGSGKSTTLRTFMVRITDPDTVAAFSVESPVEYEMPGVAQFSIPVDVNMSSEDMAAKFLAALRDVLRMDPDVLMVGEIRDHESAVLMSEFTQSGHRCYTTAHGDSAVDGLSRLCGEQIKLPAELFAGARFLSASIYQRLLPVLCPKCRVPAASSDGGLSSEKLDLLRKKFQLDPGTMYVAREGGCPDCQPAIPGLTADGTKGVTVAAEVLLPNAKMREMAAARNWAGLTRAWRETRRAGFGEGDMTGKTVYECALYLAAQGKVSVLDIEREFEPMESYEVFPMAPESGGTRL
jgi:type II secretory ATPase GspE/PulE/Tfp pilus assembly ATPase PilB-like protein